MKCEKYRDLVAAHVDGELCGDDQRGADDHASTCPACDAMRLAQADVIAILADFRTPVPTPELLRAAIERETVAAETVRPPRMAFHRRRIVVAGAIAATLLLTVLSRFRTSETAVIPLLAADIAAAETIPPNHRTASAADLRSYYAESGLSFDNTVDDLRSHGFHLVGGSVSDLHGTPTTLTVYETDGERLLCRRFRAKDFRWPEGGRRIGNSEVFSHDGVYVSLTRLSGDVICAMASRMPPERFVAALHSDH